MLSIDHRTAGDAAAIERLLDLSFGTDRHEKTAQRLRDGRLPADGLAFAAREDGELVGTITLWNVEAGCGRPALLLGPVAVDCAVRNLGIGRSLVLHALNQAAVRGHQAVILVGDAPYYGRFGFERRFTCGLMMPGPVDADRFLGLELVSGALAGASGPVMPSGLPAVPMSPPLMPIDYVAPKSDGGRGRRR